MSPRRRVPMPNVEWLGKRPGRRGSCEALWDVGHYGSEGEILSLAAYRKRG